MAYKPKDPSFLPEPSERAIHRATCPDFGYTGSCYDHSGYVNRYTHITMACDGKCPRMADFDREHYPEGTEFDLKKFK